MRLCLHLLAKGTYSALVQILGALRDIATGLWHWAKRWRWETIAFSGAFGMIRFGEYGIGAGLLIPAAFGVISKIAHSEVINIIKIFGYTLVIICLAGLLLLIKLNKKQEPWSQLPQALSAFWGSRKSTPSHKNAKAEQKVKSIAPSTRESTKRLRAAQKPLPSTPPEHEVTPVITEIGITAEVVSHAELLSQPAHKCFGY